MPATAPANAAPDTPATPVPSGKRPRRAAPAEPTVRAILDSKTAAKRAAADAAPRTRAAVLCGGLTAAVLWACFFPLDWGPLAWVALVPLCLLVRTPVPPRWSVPALWACGFLGHAAQIQWMRLGDAAMYPAWLTLSAYLGLYFPAFVLASRAAVRRGRVPLAVAVPVVWCGLEWFRAHVFTGFAWNLLGHSQWSWAGVIQVSDLFGAYAVGFVVAAVNGAVAATLPASVFRGLGLSTDRGGRPLDLPETPRRTAWRSAGGAVALLAAVLVYGAVRRAGEPFPAGPRVALVQTHDPSRMGKPADETDMAYRRLMALSEQAVPHRPDVILWPESAFPWPLFDVAEGVTDAAIDADPTLPPPDFVRSTAVRDTLGNLADRADAAFLVGLTAGDIAPGATPDRLAVRRSVSAAFAVPGAGYRGRYAKVHRVPFGEYVPLVETLPFLKWLSPFEEGMGVVAGDRPVGFEYRGTVFAPLICYEDTVPGLVRDARSGTGADVLVNLTNDGWFDGSSEQEQHLAVSVFRAVETRTPLVRAVNTGVSAVIDGDGVVRTPDVRVGPRGEPLPADAPLLYDDAPAVLVADVPLDPRGSLYVRWGDWFAVLCAACTTFALAVAAVPRRWSGAWRVSRGKLEACPAPYDSSRRTAATSFR